MLTVFNDIIADVEANKTLNRIITELFLSSQSFFKYCDIKRIDNLSLKSKFSFIVFCFFYIFYFENKKAVKNKCV